MNNKAVFLDRDGVINVDHSYVYRVEDLILWMAFLIFVVTLSLWAIN